MLPTPAINRRFTSGLTLIELLIVVVLIGAISIPLLVSYNTTRTTQALFSSTQQVLNHTTSARIFAREARSQREWGVKNLDAHSYVIYSKGSSGETIENAYSLEPGIRFVNDFEILFEIGSGGAGLHHSIVLRSSAGAESVISVLPSGVVEVQN